MQSIEQSGGDKGRLAARRFGDPDRPPLVLVHGFTQSSSSWRKIALDLAREHHVIAVDLPGHGASSAIEATDFDDTARILGETCGRAIYVGYSLGGRIAIALALKHPELVQALAVVGASPGIADDQERLARRRQDDALADRLDARDEAPGFASMESFLDAWLAQPLFAHLSSAAQHRAARRMNSLSGLATSLRTTGTGQMPPVHRRLSMLAMPVCCMAGSNDARYLAIARDMAQAIGPNAMAVAIAGAGHAAPFEQPTRFLRALRAFVVNTVG